MSDQTFMAWAAGYFDGEGSVMIVRAGKKTPGRTLSVAISTTDFETVQLFHERWGGHFSERPQRNPRWKNAIAWQVTGRAAAEFLLDIEPHVRSSKNKQRIKLAVEFQTGKGGQGVKRSSERIALEEEMGAAMCRLNSRGPEEDEQLAA